MLSLSPKSAPRRRPNIALLGTATLLSLIAGQPVARASILSWNTIGGGSASTPGNWSPAAIPAAADDLVYSLSATYSVTFNASTTTSRTQSFRAGTVTVAMSAPHTTSSGIAISDLAGNSAGLNFTTGTWNCGASLLAAGPAGTLGVLQIDDDDADLLLNGVGADCTIGSSGTGALTIIGGGLLEVADQFIAAANTSSTSILNISGATAGLPFARSTLRVLGTSQSRFGAGGDANVTIGNAALAQFEGSLVVANTSTSTSSVTVGGAGGIINTHARLDVAGDLLLGRNTSSLGAGAAALTVNNSGDVIVGGTLFLASDPDGGSATLTTTPGSLLSTHSLTIGETATLDLQGGQVNIDGGTLLWTSNTIPMAISGSPNTPVVAMINGASGTLNPVLTGDALRIGQSAGANIAAFNILSGSDLAITAGRVVLGRDADDTGRMTVSGAGSTLTNSPTTGILTVGLAGTGELTADLAATVSARTLEIGSTSGSTGDVLFTGPDTAASFQHIAVGGAPSAAGGAGTLTVNDQAVLTSSPAGTLNIWSGGVLTVSNSGFIGATDLGIDLSGDLRLENQAQVSAANIVARSGSRIQARSTLPGASFIDSAIDLLPGASIELLTGDLSIGKADSTGGIDALSGTTITVNEHNLFLLDANRAGVDQVSIAGGSITATNGINLISGGRITGFGTINGDVSFTSGSSGLTATGSGLTLNGMLTNVGGSSTGTRFIFGGAGGWTGAGTIAARAQFNAGTQIVANGNMTIGALATDGVILNGSLNTRDKTVTLIDSNGIGLGPVTTLGLDNAAEGRVICDSQLVLNAGRTLEGRGTLDSPTLLLFGDLRPGGQNDASNGALRFSDNGLPHTTTFNATTSVELDFFPAPPIPGTVLFDAIDVFGALHLDGHLTVQPHTTSLPISRVVWAVIAADTLTGTFSSVDLPPRFTLSYSPTSVLLTFCPPDFNNSGSVTVQDIFDYLAAYFSAAPGADFNSSGAITVQDIFDFLAAYFAGC